MAYNQRCIVCKKNVVLMQHRRQRPICLECEMKDLFEPIENKKMQRLFEVPKKLYEESYFLRDVRRKYNMFGNISDKQIEVFKRVVKDLQDPIKQKEYAEKRKAKAERKKKRSASLLTVEERRMLGLEVAPKVYK